MSLGGQKCNAMFNFKSKHEFFLTDLNKTLSFRSKINIFGHVFISGMNMIIIVSSRFFKYFTRSFASAIALFPFIIVRKTELKNNPKLVYHERIHLRQQLELGIIVFYVWYVMEFLIRFAFTRSFGRAYRNICFEREAYSNESNDSYLKNRKCWSFIYFIAKPVG
jgi:hypothetical protein